jgi:membrane protein
MNRIAPMITNAMRGAKYLLQRYRDDRLSEIAAALVYMSLFALVPLLTVLYTIASAVPAFDNMEGELQNLLLRYMLPDQSQQIVGYLNEFSKQAKNLTGFGIAILFVTAVLMLRNVERAFNNIWRTRENRGAVASFLLYWAVLSLAPLLLGLGVGVRAYLYAAANALAGLDVLGVGGMFLSLVPFFLSALSLGLLYIAVPNCEVPFRHALIGGTAAALAFSVARVLFTSIMAGTSYTLVYGAFAAVPLFLLWLYITWNIVLFGAIITHGMSAYQSDLQASRPLLLKALDTLYLLWLAQREGQSLRELDLLRDRSVVVGGLDSDSWRSIRDRLKDAQLIAQGDRGDYLLARDLHDITLDDLKALINDERPVPDDDDIADWQRAAVNLLKQQRDQQASTLNTPLATLFREKATQ